MYKYITHKEIDFNKWDDCINNSSNRTIYALSGYLDVVSPVWDAIINEKDRRYKGVFPATKQKKLSFTFLKSHFNLWFRNNK